MMTTRTRRALHAAGTLLAVSSLLVGCERPPVETTQHDFRGLALVDVQNPRRSEAVREANRAPDPLPQVEPFGRPAGEVYQNVQVLHDLDAAEFSRLMGALTSWVSPEQGCNYCHAGGNLVVDAPYTKIVSRRMIQMTRHINEEWREHVGETGVTCYTCHRGQPVPEQYWVMEPGSDPPGLVGNRAGQNTPVDRVGLTSLPYDPFPLFFSTAPQEIRVQAASALPMGDGGASIQETEATYGLMMHVSRSLGVNCTYCHNTRSFMPWEASSQARVNAWHAVRMVRHLNDEYMGSLTDVFPPERKGPAGDVFKIECGTCHRGQPKPLNGAPMRASYSGLGGE